MKKPSGVGGAPSAGRASGGGRGIMAEVRESSKREIEALAHLGDGTDTSNKHLAKIEEILGKIEGKTGDGGGVVPGQERDGAGGAAGDTDSVGDKIRDIADSMRDMVRPKVLTALEKGTVPATTQAYENRQLLYASLMEEHFRRLLHMIGGDAPIMRFGHGGGLAHLRIE
jgi:hypothetical protein